MNTDLIRLKIVCVLIGTGTLAIVGCLPAQAASNSAYRPSAPAPRPMPTAPSRPAQQLKLTPNYSYTAPPPPRAPVLAQPVAPSPSRFGVVPTPTGGTGGINPGVTGYGQSRSGNNAGTLGITSTGSGAEVKGTFVHNPSTETARDRSQPSVTQPPSNAYQNHP